MMRSRGHTERKSTMVASIDDATRSERQMRGDVRGRRNLVGTPGILFSGKETAWCSCAVRPKTSGDCGHCRYNQDAASRDHVPGSADTYPPLHEWVYKHATQESINLFLQYKADTTLVDQVNHWTAIHYFASNGKDVEALNLLMNDSQSGRKPDINRNENSSPLHVLLERHQVPGPLLQVRIGTKSWFKKNCAHVACTAT